MTGAASPAGSRLGDLRGSGDPKEQCRLKEELARITL